MAFDKAAAPVTDFAPAPTAPCEYLPLVAACDVPPRAPWFAAGFVPPHFAERFAADQARLPPLGILRLASGWILGRGLPVSAAGELLTGPALGIRAERLVHPRWRLPLVLRPDGDYDCTAPSRVREMPGRSLLLCKRGDHIYGHWLLDMLPRLALLEDASLSYDRILLSCHAPAYVEALLAACGVDAGRLQRFDEKSEALRCEQLLLPTQARLESALAPRLATFFASLRTVPGDGPRRLFLSRRSWLTGKRRLVDLDAAARALRSRGFTEVLPETLDFTAQRVLFAGAEAIVGEFGSALHNSLFAPPGTRVLVLQGNNTVSSIQAGIGRLLDQPTGFLFGEAFNRRGNGINGDYLVDTDQLERVLDEHFP